MESYWDEYQNSKPTVKLQNWYIGSDVIWDPYKAPEQRSYVLFGNVYGHPKFEDGEKIYSSPIVESNGRTIKTKNTTYILGDIDVTYFLWCEEHNIDIDNDNPIKIIYD